MTSIDNQIVNACNTISDNINSLSSNRDLLSRNIIKELRDLIEATAVRLHLRNGATEFQYDLIKPAMSWVGSQRKQISFLYRFHELVQMSASHYSLNGDAAQRLMLKYYEYLLRIRTLLHDIGINVLANLESFPLNLDPALKEYYDKIASRIDAVRSSKLDKNPRWDRYYIHSIRPFFVDNRVYYEVTFTTANDRTSKFDRIIGFTDIDMTDKYAAKMVLASETISVLGRSMPITIIRAWQVSIRPCEIEHFAELFGDTFRVNQTSSEYRYLMKYLTTNAASLLDVIDMPDADYRSFRAAGLNKAKVSNIFVILDKSRHIIRSELPGSNTLRYLMLRMNNVVIKKQYSRGDCDKLSDLNLSYGCIPFDEMPFCTSLPGHNPRFADLAASLDMSGRIDELLDRRVRENVETRGMLYTPIADLADFGDLAEIQRLVERFNKKLYRKHKDRKLIIDKGHIFIRGYEDETVAIIKKLQEFASSGIDGYSAAVDFWLKQPASPPVDDPLKQVALTHLFDQSRVAIIYGAAGTGKTTMINYIASYFVEKSKLFLAQTNSAVDNLQRRVSAANSSFHTIASIRNIDAKSNYDMLFIDECSTVSNADLLEVLNTVSCKLIVLVGDVFQIQSIHFGNWFATIKSFVPSTSVFELKNPYRTKNNKLIDVWNKVRNIDDDITEALSSGGYSSGLDKSLFQQHVGDGIILCLNYDGLYGINNINRFLQSNNCGKEVRRGAMTYKMGDPVLFNEIERFKPLIYNNLKGWIVGIDEIPGKIAFDIKLDRSIDASDTWGYPDLTWIGDSTVRFDVYESGNGDEDDETPNTIVPFQVAYAVSIHKAQGLEYNSVKVVITQTNREDVTHNVFYTAITRARKNLCIFWTPETQKVVIDSFKHTLNDRDVGLLVSRCHLQKTPNLHSHSLRSIKDSN